MPRLPMLSMAMPVTFLGCGKLASSLLDGLLASVYSQSPPMKSSSFSNDGINTSNALKTFVPTALVACVRRESSAEALIARYESDSIVHILQDANVEGASMGDVIILGCKPTAYKEILSAEGMKEALSGQKVLINLMLGVSTKDITETIYGLGPFSRGVLEQQCAVVNCIPNTAASVMQSMTLLYEDEDPLPGWALEVVIALFNRIGQVKRIPHSLKHLSPVMSTLAASSAAFFTVALEGVANGAVEQGLNHTTATEIAAAAMRGAADLLLGGETPEGVRKRIATKGGSTAQGLDVLERKEIMQAMSEAMTKAAETVSRMGDKAYWKQSGEQMLDGTKPEREPAEEQAFEDPESEEPNGETRQQKPEKVSEEPEPEEHETNHESTHPDPQNQTAKAEDTADQDMGK